MTLCAITGPPRSIVQYRSCICYRPVETALFYTFIRFELTQYRRVTVRLRPMPTDRQTRTNGQKCCSCKNAPAISNEQERQEGGEGACAQGGTVQGAAFDWAKIWNSETWPVLANWHLHCTQ